MDVWKIILLFPKFQNELKKLIRNSLKKVKKYSFVNRLMLDIITSAYKNINIYISLILP